MKINILLWGVSGVEISFLIFIFVQHSANAGFLNSPEMQIIEYSDFGRQVDLW